MYSAQIRSSRTFLQKQIPSSKTRFLGAAILALSSVTWAEPTSTLPEEKATDYMSKVRSCLDNLLEHGTDHYGPVHTSMLMSVMDTRTNESPREPEELDGLIRSEGRLHRLNYRGADLWDDQPLIRTLYTMTDVTDDARYADAAAAYIQDYFTYAKKENGLLSWGSHIYYDAYADQPAGDQNGKGPHETLVLCPDWERMWAVAPERVQRQIELTWEWHVVDKKTGLHNRHDDKRKGCDFAFSGGEFGNAFAFLYTKTGKDKHRDWSRLIFNRHWDARNTDTNLSPDAPSTGERYDAHHSFSTLSGPHAALLMQAYVTTGDAWYRDMALAHIRAWGKHAWDAEAQLYHGMLKLDGTPIPAMKRDDASYDVWKPTGHADTWRATMFSYEFTLYAAQTAVYAHHLTGDTDALKTAKQWATHIRSELPVFNGRRWKKEILETLPDAAETGGGYAENYGRAISFFLKLYRVTGNQEDFDTAMSIADEAVEKLYSNGWFKGHPAKPYYMSTDGVAYLLYALTELAAYPEEFPPNL